MVINERVMLLICTCTEILFRSLTFYYSFYFLVEGDREGGTEEGVGNGWVGRGTYNGSGNLTVTFVCVGSLCVVVEALLVLLPLCCFMTLPRLPKNLLRQVMSAVTVRSVAGTKHYYKYFCR